MSASEHLDDVAPPLGAGRADQAASTQAADETLERALREQHLPVLQGQEIQGFPKFPDTYPTHMAQHMALEDALTKRFPYDAHLIAHSNPRADRRIGKEVFDEPDAL